MKPVPLLFVQGPQGTTTSYSWVKATPVATDATVNQAVTGSQQPQQVPERKGLQLNVKRLYQLDLGGQPTEVQPHILPTVYLY